MELAPTGSEIEDTWKAICRLLTFLDEKALPYVKELISINVLTVLSAWALT